MRRILTGLDSDGRSTVASIETIEGMDVWQADLTEVPKWVVGRGKLMPFEPDPGQVKVMAVTFPPAVGENAAELSPDVATGLHKTRSIDVIFVRDPLLLVLETGEVPVDAGDVVVQRGTMHDWRNTGSEPARMIGFSWGVGGPDGLADVGDGRGA